MSDEDLLILLFQLLTSLCSIRGNYIHLFSDMRAALHKISEQKTSLGTSGLFFLTSRQIVILCFHSIAFSIPFKPFFHLSVTGTGLQSALESCQDWVDVLEDSICREGGSRAASRDTTLTSLSASYVKVEWMPKIYLDIFIHNLKFLFISSFVSVWNTRP